MHGSMDKMESGGVMEEGRREEEGKKEKKGSLRYLLVDLNNKRKAQEQSSTTEMFWKFAVRDYN